MKLYLLTQTAVHRYDVYLEAVVAANNEQEAREMHPIGGVVFNYERNAWLYSNGVVYQDSDDVCPDWPVHPAHVTATLIGDSINSRRNTHPYVICASFNAG